MKQSENQQTAERAQQYAKKNRQSISKQKINPFYEEANPVSIFMAGSPGAGKTETSKRLVENIGNLLRIDADELRDHFRECGYQGSNSHLFQLATTTLVHKIHDDSLKKKISFLLDGTFANENMARLNIERSVKRKRAIFILFVYQLPMSAWNFVQQREIVEGRRIQPEDFASKFCASRKVANKMKKEFGHKIVLSLLCKNIDGTNKFYKKSVACIDHHIPEKYTEEKIMAEIQGMKI